MRRFKSKKSKKTKTVVKPLRHRHPVQIIRKIGRKTVKTEYAPRLSKHQIYDTKSRALDLTHHALPTGKRISKNGNIYYEYRSSHSDRRGSRL